MRRRATSIQIALAIVGLVTPAALSRTGAAALDLPNRDASAGHASHQASFTIPSGARNDRLGSAVAISGKTVVVGAPGRKVHGHREAGAAYVFTRPRAGWTHLHLVTTLTLARSKSKAAFGASVAVTGSTIVVGAPTASRGSDTYEGEAFVFTKPSSGWAGVHHPTGRLAPADGSTYGAFGLSVAASGRTVVVGAPGHVVGQHNAQGTAYVFTRPSKGWAALNPPNAELTASDGLAYNDLGFSVAIDRSTIVAGAPYRKVGRRASAGTAYVFVKPASGWRSRTQSAELVDSAPARKNYLGDSVAITGDTVAAGLPDHSVAGTPHAGAIAVFTRPASGWSGTRQERSTLDVSPGVRNAYFGQGLAASGTRIIGSGYGLVSVFVRPGHSWSGTHHQSDQLTGTAPGDFLGSGIAIAGRTIVAGAPSQTVRGHANQGALYVFRR